MIYYTNLFQVCLLCHTEKKTQTKPKLWKTVMDRVSFQPKYKTPLKQKYKSLHLIQNHFSITSFLEIEIEVSVCLLLPIQMKNTSNCGVRARLHPLEKTQYRGAVERLHSTSH